MEIKKINIGLIGAGFMAKAHSIAYAGMPMFFWPAPAIPVKKMIVDMNEDIARDAKDKLGFEAGSGDLQIVFGIGAAAAGGQTEGQRRRLKGNGRRMAGPVRGQILHGRFLRAGREDADPGAGDGKVVFQGHHIDPQRPLAVGIRAADAHGLVHRQFLFDLLLHPITGRKKKCVRRQKNS